MTGHRGAALVNQHGTPDCMVVAPARRALDWEDLDYARRCLARGWGCQAIAQQLRCNETDLKRALGIIPSVAAPSAPPVSPLADRDRLLLALDQRGRTRGELRDMLGLSPAVLDDLLRKQVSAGLVLRDGPVRGAGGQWFLTPEGRARLVMAHRRAADRGIKVTEPPPRSPPVQRDKPVGQARIRFRAHTQQAQVLLALDDGVPDMAALAARELTAPGILSIVVSTLRREGLVARPWGLTDHGKAVAARIREVGHA